MAKLHLALLTLLISTSVSAQDLAQIQKTQANNKQNHQEQIKAAMRACTAMTQDGDVKGRSMAKNVQLELGDTCIVQKPSQDSITLLNKQIKNAFSVVNATEMWGDINNIALERTVKSVWATYMKLIKDEKLTATSAQAMICKYTPELCKNKSDLKFIQAAFANFQKETAAKPVKFLTGPEQANILKNELQPLITRANKTCAATRKKYFDIKNAHSCMKIPDLTQIKFKDGKWDKEANKNVVIKPIKPMSQMECDIQLEKAYNLHRKLHSVATQSIELDMQLIVGSKLGSLLITEDLRKKMGVLKEDFAYEKCMKGDGGVLNQVWNKDLFQARNDFFALTVKELRKIRDYRVGDYSDHSKKQTLKQYLKTNPSTVAELLRRKPDPNKVYAMCSLIKTIQGWDKAWQIVDGVVIGTGIVASIALGFTGVGAPAGAALASVVIGSTAISVTKASIDYASQIHQDGRLRSAVATQQKNLDQALADLKVSDERKEGYLNNIKFTAIAETAGFGLGKGLKLLAQFRQARNLAKVAPTVSGLSLVDEAAMAKKLETAATTFRNEAKALGPKSSHLSKVTIEQEAEIAMLYTKLDAKSAKTFTKKLSQLKTPEEITAFLKAAQKNPGENLAHLNKLVDGSKKNPPMYIKVEKSPSTGSLYVKLSAEEQARLVKAAKDLKKMKLDDAATLKKLSSIQSNCLQKGILKKGCFQTQLTKIEREIAADSIHQYMNAGYAKILDKAKKTEQTIKTATEPVVYDVVAIGAGPHNGIAINAMKEVDPNLKVLVVDKTENLGVFHHVKGFDINTPEYLRHSGNTFPGSPTQLKDFNVDKRIFATAEELGEQTQATFQYADPDILFKNQVMTVTKEPTPGAWPAKWKIETNTGLTVYSRAGISNQGFGDFATRLKDTKSIELVEKHHSTFMMKDLAKDTKYAPPVTSVDDLLPIVHQDVRLGRNAVDRFDDGDVLVIGSGDGGNIAIEALTGLNKKLNPSGADTNVKIKWLSQEAKTGDEYVKTLNERTIKRYSRIGKKIDSKQVEPVNGYLARIEEFTDEAGNIKFRAYYTTKDGVPVGEPIVAKHIVFSTGYPNNQSHITPLFNKMGTAEEVAFQPIKGNIDEYTRYPQFSQEETFTTRQLVVKGEPQDWYSSGVGGKIPASSVEKTKIPVGGSLDVLAPKSASTGRMIAKQITAEKNLANKPLVASSEKPRYYTLKARPSTKAQYKIENEAVANIDLKLQVGKALRGKQFAPNGEFSIVVSKNKAGNYYFEVNGLDEVTSQELITLLGKNPDLTHDLNSYFKLGKTHIEIKVGSRADGTLKLEDLVVNSSKTRIISQVKPPAPGIKVAQFDRPNVQLEVKEGVSDGHTILANDLEGKNMAWAMVSKESNVFTKEGKLIEGFDIDVSVAEAAKGQRLEEYLILNSAVELEKQGKKVHSTHDLSVEMRRAWENFEKQGVATRKSAQYMGKDVEIFEFNTSAISNKDFVALEQNIHKAKLVNAKTYTSKLSENVEQILTKNEGEAFAKSFRIESSPEGSGFVVAIKNEDKMIGTSMASKNTFIRQPNGELVDGDVISFMSSGNYIQSPEIESLVILSSGAKLSKTGRRVFSPHNLSGQSKQVWEELEKAGLATRRNDFYMNQQVEFFELNSKEILGQVPADLRRQLESITPLAPKTFQVEKVAADPSIKAPTSGRLAASQPIMNVAPASATPTLKVIHQKMTKMYVNMIKAVTKERSFFTIVGDKGVKLNVGAQLGKGSRGVVSDLESYEGIPNLAKDGEYVAKLGHTLKGMKSPLSGSTQSLKRELEIYDDVAANLSKVKKSDLYPKDPAWGESLPLCKIHYSMESPEGLVLIKDKIKGQPMDKLLAANGGRLTPEMENSLKEVYDLNQALYQRQKITVNGVEGPFSGDIAKANLMWIEDAQSLKQLGYKRPGFVLLELDVHYKNGPKFIKGNMSFDEYKQYIESN